MVKIPSIKVSIEGRTFVEVGSFEKHSFRLLVQTSVFSNFSKSVCNRDKEIIPHGFPLT